MLTFDFQRSIFSKKVTHSNNNRFMLGFMALLIYYIFNSTTQLDGTIYIFIPIRRMLPDAIVPLSDNTSNNYCSGAGACKEQEPNRGPRLRGPEDKGPGPGPKQN